MSSEVECLAGKDAHAGATWKRIATFCLLGGVFVTAGVFAYATLFSRFSYWDDEGYFLIALRAYQTGQGLYEQIETIYGPFYFQAVAGLFSLLHVPLDNVSARWFVFCLWMVSGLAVYRFVRLVTASVFAGVLAYVLSFPILRVLANEPLHPCGLIALLLSVLVLLSRSLDAPGRRTGIFIAGGFLTAALALSKINVGVFAFIACAAYFLRTAPKNQIGRILRAGSAVLLPFIPFFLMATRLGNDAFFGFALYVSLALLPFGYLPWLESEKHSSWCVYSYLLGGLVLTTAVLALCFFTGTGMDSLWHSLVTKSLHFPGKFAIPLTLGTRKALAVFAAIPLCLGALMYLIPRFGAISRTLLKLIGGLAILGLCLLSFRNPPMLALPLVWLVALPGHSSNRSLKARTFLALLVVLQSLQVYPVAGSQIGSFAYLFPVVGVIVIWDAFGELPLRWRKALDRMRWKLAGTMTFLLVCLTALFVVNPILQETRPGVNPTLSYLRTSFKQGVPLALPGAESIRLPEDYAVVLQWVAYNLAQNADTFVGLPGVHSFYGWSHLPPPVPFYPHTWIAFSSDATQEKILQALLASKRPCIVRQRKLIALWMRSRTPEGPLVRASEQMFRMAGKAGGYELLFPLSVQPDLVLSGFFVDLPREWLDRYEASTAMRLSFPAMPGVHVTRLVVRNPQTCVDVFDTAADSSVRRPAILDMDGKELLHDNLAGSIDLSQRLDVLMLCPPTTPALPRQEVLVRAFDKQGRIVARLLMPDVGEAIRNSRW
jgi:hypothetical protein